MSRRIAIGNGKKKDCLKLIRLRIALLYCAKRDLHIPYALKFLLGATWLRRGSRNLRGMPRGRSPRKHSCKLKIVANDDNCALAA